MRSSERSPADVGAVVVALVCAMAVATLRPRLAERFHEFKLGSDVYALPSPEQTVAVSLGWRAALADLIYAHVLVSYGLHVQERRRFEFVGRYLETIVALDPKFRAPYHFADTLLTLEATPARREDYYEARKILERGMDEFPFDAELWNNAGQFMAYLAPSGFVDEAEKKEWRLAGARRLARACELVGQNDSIPFHCITAAGILTGAGQHEAAAEFLKRVLAVSDNDEIRSLALGYLGKAISERQRDEVEWQNQLFVAAWGKDLRFVGKNMVLLVGPPLDAPKCAGTPARWAPECAATWRSFGDRVERR